MGTMFWSQIQLLWIKSDYDGSILFSDIGRRTTPISMVVNFPYDVITNHLNELSLYPQ